MTGLSHRLSRLIVLSLLTGGVLTSAACTSQPVTSPTTSSASTTPTASTTAAASSASSASSTEPASPGSSGAAATSLPPVKHLFVINIENKGYETTWGPRTAAPYLAQKLRSEGLLLPNYYATAHRSQPNYIAEISGQGPTRQMQDDCKIYSTFTQTGTAGHGQAIGSGCVFPASVPNLTEQLDAKGLSWKGYMEDMGTPCRHPALGATDTTQKARVGDQYAVRHNPFMYFAGITGAADCGQHVVDLTALTADLASASTTPTLSYIIPNLCHDGHDSPCVDGEPGGLTSVNIWLQTWIPRILGSAAYKDGGMIFITAEESDSPNSDSSSCCGEEPGPNAPLPGIVGPGGGRVGALVLSPFVTPGTVSTTSYNHYSLLASIEDLFRLPYLGYAGVPGLSRFGRDVYNGRWPS